MGWKTRAGALAAGALLAMPAAAGASELVVQRAADAPRGDGSLGPAAARAMSEGYLVPDEAEYARQKADAAAAAPGAEGLGSADQQLAPALVRGFDGIFDRSRAPSDSTSAVGTTRFMELINSRYAIYSKTGTTPMAQGTLKQLAGIAGNDFDPQILWDHQTNRWYYTMDLIVDPANHLLAFGFSKSASPSNGTADWCKYHVNYGTAFPDYPKLGDSQHFIIIGSNVFGPSSFLRSDVLAISKPGAGTTCPSPASFKAGVSAVRDPSGSVAFTPVPANQVDANPVGAVVARTGGLPSTRLSVHRVTRSTTGNPVIQATGNAVTVPGYTVPAQAKQRSGVIGSNKTLDTLDARPTQAVSAVNPARGTSVQSLYTQHTTLGGVGAEVRWYEIQAPTATGAPVLKATGKVSSTSEYRFNGAISPDRMVNGTTRRFGSAWVLGYTGSSTTRSPFLTHVSRVGISAAASAPAAPVRASPNNYQGFDCAGSDNSCRWGDYAAATPDPVVAASEPVGRIWNTNQYARSGTSTTRANWGTWNWVVKP